MERLLLERFHLHLSPTSSSSSSSPLRLTRSLAIARALMANRDSSDTTRRSTADALVRALADHGSDASFLRGALYFLGEAAALHPSLAPAVLSAVRSFLDGPDRLAADALAALAAIARSSSMGFSFVASVLDGDLVLSLVRSSSVAVRSRILDLLVSSIYKSRGSVILGHNCLFRVFLALTVDLYPSLRIAAINGLIALCKEIGADADSLIVRCCYNRAVELLKDEDELVRSAAVRLVSSCRELFRVGAKGTDSSEQTELIFVQLCSMARDMSKQVRIEAFDALGNVKEVSESALLQSLSKKVLGNRSGSKIVSKCEKETKLSFSRAAGTFIHGIEDEHHEVRAITCKSLGMLAIFSVRFADEALSLLMDMLNDDAEVVRLQTLETIFLMATYDHLKVQEKHMHMFLGLLADISALVRTAARKSLRLMKLPNLEIFKLVIDGLITNLETNPEEEEDIFYVLFFVGKNHRKFSAKLAKDLAKEIKPSSGEMTLDNPRISAMLVVSISSSFPDKKYTCDIPAVIFSYAATLLGRISCALQDVIHRDALLAYLCRYSGMPFLDKTSDSKEAGEICSPPNQNEASDCCKVTVSDSHEPQHSKEKEEHLSEELMQSVEVILKTVGQTWPLVKACRAYEVQRIFRTCKEELEMLAQSASGPASAFLDFALQYVQVIQLVAEFWEQIQAKSSHSFGMVALEILVEKIDMSLKRLTYCFRGLHSEIEFHILELSLFATILRLSKFGIFSDSVLKKLQKIISRLEFLSSEGSIMLSDFSKEVSKAVSERRMNSASQQINHCNLLDLFDLRQITFYGGFKSIKGELRALDNNSENPLLYISGLPVGIRYHITLCNVSNNDRLWLRMVVGESIEYVFLDLGQFGGNDDERSCTIVLPFYATPNASSFVLRACLCIECPSENMIYWKENQGGPKGEIALLFEECDVYFANIGKR
ncbi:protein SIEL isoform X2 [Ananas comosus]|uniref:Protein SIEL isoform X2 n=1 Tax=Ananas comosus TaxID=4615 RepID=A0A6P5GLJ9_ANACO|nr:protein SIEL isoform X2 [Ananas comosus]